MSTPGVQLHTYVEKRLLAWMLYVRWSDDAFTRDPTPQSVKSWWLTIVMRPNVRMQRSPEVRRDCPVDEIECGVTQLCLQQLPRHLCDAVLLCWLANGTAEDKARELGCCRATYFNRLNAAYAELIGLLNDHESGVLRVDLDDVNAKLEAERVHAPEPGPVTGRVKRAAQHGIARDVRADLAPPKKTVAGA